jgi:hypothetical protein
MANTYTCHLSKSSPRYRDWRAILGSDEAPIENPIPISATFGKSREQIEVHRLDLKRFTPEQMQRLVAWCISEFGRPAEEVEATIKRDGFPIRAEDVTVAIDHRLFT